MESRSGRILAGAILGAIVGVPLWVSGVYVLGSLQAGHALSSAEYPSLAPLAAVVFGGPVGAIVGALAGSFSGSR